MIQHFERNRDVKMALDLGIAEKLPEWMEDSHWGYDDYFDVWRWAIEEKKDFIFPYIVERRGQKWINGEVITVGMEDNNSLLWESVSSNYLPAVQAILEIPDLFCDETFNMKVGASPINEYFYRGETKTSYRATNFGAFVQVAMTNGKGHWELKDALTDYYKKHKKNDDI
jgi:hypothetical protein